MTYKISQLGGGGARLVAVLTSGFLLLAVGSQGQALREETTCDGKTPDLELDGLGTNCTLNLGI